MSVGTSSLGPLSQLVHFQPASLLAGIQCKPFWITHDPGLTVLPTVLGVDELKTFSPLPSHACPLFSLKPRNNPRVVRLLRTLKGLRGIHFLPRHVRQLIIKPSATKLFNILLLILQDIF